MKISNHTIIVENYPKKGEHLLYHTRTQALIKIGQALRDTLRNISEIDLGTDTLNGQKEDIVQLYQMGILTKDEAEDQERLKKYLTQIKHGINKKIFVVNLLTTYACNFQCTYCFQESSRTFEKLDFETSEHAIFWIQKRIDRLGYSGVYINYYGGEPLLNLEAIDHISRQMKSWCGEQGINFNIGFQTNGYLLSPGLVEKYLKLGLKDVRISLDGVKEDNDRFRVLRSGEGTFDKIIKNILSCVDKVKISISMSYDKSDVEPVARLLDYFDRLGVLPKLGKFIFSPVHPTLGPKEHPELIQNSQCMCNMQDEKLANAARRINELLVQKGLPGGSGMANNTCPVTRENSGVTIDQHGRLYKCNSMLGHPELSVGNVKEEDYNEVHREFRDLDVWRQCPADCTYLPMCSGGCRLMSFLENKNFRTPGCKKPYLNKMAAEFIKKDYDAMTGKS